MKRNADGRLATAAYKFVSRLLFIVIVCVFMVFVWRMIFGEG